MSNVFQNAYSRIESPGSPERACKPTSAARDKRDLPGLSSCRSCRCFSDKPLLEALNCFLEKPVLIPCGFLGFPSTSPDGNDLNHPCTSNKPQCYPLIPTPGNRESGSEAGFQGPQSIPSRRLQVMGKILLLLQSLFTVPLNTTNCQKFLTAWCYKTDFHCTFFLRYKLCWNCSKKKR